MRWSRWCNGDDPAAAAGAAASDRNREFDDAGLLDPDDQMLAASGWMPRRGRACCDFPYSAVGADQDDGFHAQRTPVADGRRRGALDEHSSIHVRCVAASDGARGRLGPARPRRMPAPTLQRGSTPTGRGPAGVWPHAKWHCLLGDSGCSGYHISSQQATLVLFATCMAAA